MLFGRLYFHLDAKYRYKQDSGAQVHLFSLQVGSEQNCVNFPYLAALLAEKDEEHRRQLWALWMSIAALILSIASIVAQVVTSPPNAHGPDAQQLTPDERRSVSFLARH